MLPHHLVEAMILKNEVRSPDWVSKVKLVPQSPAQGLKDTSPPKTIPVSYPDAITLTDPSQDFNLKIKFLVWGSLTPLYKDKMKLIFSCI